MPVSPQQLMLVVGLPGIGALVLLLLASGRKWAGPLSAACVVLAGFPFIAGSLHVFPPQESLGWFFHLAILAGIAGVIDAVHPRVWLVRFVAVFLLVAASSYVMLKSHMQSIDTAEALLTLACIGATGAAWWAAADWAERDPSSGSAAAWMFWILSTTIAITISMNGSINYAQIALTLAAAAAAGVIASLLRARAFARGTSIVYTILPVMLIVGAHFLVDLPHTYVAGLLCTPLAIAVGRLIPVASLRPWQRTTLRVAPVALLMAVLLTVVVIDFRRSQSETGDEQSAARTMDRSIEHWRTQASCRGFSCCWC